MAAALARRNVPSMINAAALLLMVVLASAPFGRGKEEECTSLFPVFKECLKVANLTTDPYKDKLLSDECCNNFAKHEGCLCKLRSMLAATASVIDPKKPLCRNDTGCMP